MTQKYLRNIVVIYREMQNDPGELFKYCLLPVLEDLIAQRLLEANLITEDDVDAADADGKFKQYVGHEKIGIVVENKVKEILSSESAEEIEVVLEWLEDYLKKNGIEITLKDYALLESRLRSKIKTREMEMMAQLVPESKAGKTIRYADDLKLPDEIIVPATEDEIVRFNEKEKSAKVVPFDPSRRRK